MKKCRLELVGITYNQIESGVYAVVLKQAGGTRRIPIIIGFPEAQAIECKLQEVVTPRPLTHDLMVNVMSSFGISLQEVNIYKTKTGVFCAELLLSDGVDTHIIDSRSSDAIALAIRVGAPIYTTPEVLEEAGFEPSDNTEKKVSAFSSTHSFTGTPAEKDASSLNDPKSLMEAMQKAAEAEDYEEAARLKALLDKSNEENNKNKDSHEE